MQSEGKKIFRGKRSLLHGRGDGGMMWPIIME